MMKLITDIVTLMVETVATLASAHYSVLTVNVLLEMIGKKSIIY